MPTKEISQSREGRDQGPDLPTKGAASSNRGIRDFATRQETYPYAANNELSQQKVGEQAYEQEHRDDGHSVLRLRGGGNDPFTGLYKLIKCFYGCYKNNKNQKRFSEYNRYIAELRAERSTLNQLSFGDFKRENPDLSKSAFESYKKSRIQENQNEIDETLVLGWKGWHQMRKSETRLAQYSDGASTSRN